MIVIQARDAADAYHQARAEVESLGSPIEGGHFICNESTMIRLNHPGLCVVSAPRDGTSPFQAINELLQSALQVNPPEQATPMILKRGYAPLSGLILCPFIGDKDFRMNVHRASCQPITPMVFSLDMATIYAVGGIFASMHGLALGPVTYTVDRLVIPSSTLPLVQTRPTLYGEAMMTPSIVFPDKTKLQGWRNEVDMFLTDSAALGFVNPFIRQIGMPIAAAGRATQEKNWTAARVAIGKCRAPDWKAAVEDYIDLAEAIENATPAETKPPETGTLA